MRGGRGRRELATLQGRKAVVLHGHALQPWMANALTSVPVPVLGPKAGAHQQDARWCMEGLHQGGLRLGEEGEHDECKELQAWEAQQQQNIPPCARTCSNWSSLQSSIHAAACSSRGHGLCLGGQGCTGQPSSSALSSCPQLTTGKSLLYGSSASEN